MASISEFLAIIRAIKFRESLEDMKRISNAYLFSVKPVIIYEIPNFFIGAEIKKLTSEMIETFLQIGKSSAFQNKSQVNS